MMSSRLDKLRQKLVESGLDAILISQGENRRYLSGFTGSAGFLLISEKNAILATDFRYVEQAKGQAPDFEVFRTEGGLDNWFAELASSIGAKRIGFEAGDLSFSTFQKLVQVKGEKRLDLIPTEEMVELLRAIKDEQELQHIAKAVELADAVFEQIASSIRPKMTEKEVAWEIEKHVREMGGHSVPFNIIVASGPNSALPHATPTERPIGRGEPVVIDMGARIEGYCSDLSRTICIGDEDETFHKIYDLVLGAQLTAIATIAAGMSGEEADALARTVIEQGGYGEAFGHSLGHGVGLAPHELPRLGKGSTANLADGMVFTVEPGVYISGWGGVRIEDMVVLEKGKVRVLSKARKID